MQRADVTEIADAGIVRLFPAWRRHEHFTSEFEHWAGIGTDIF